MPGHSGRVRRMPASHRNRPDCGARARREPGRGSQRSTPGSRRNRSAQALHSSVARPSTVADRLIASTTGDVVSPRSSRGAARRSALFSSDARGVGNRLLARHHASALGDVTPIRTASGRTAVPIRPLNPNMATTTAPAKQPWATTVDLEIRPRTLPSRSSDCRFAESVPRAKAIRTKMTKTHSWTPSRSHRRSPPTRSVWRAPTTISGRRSSGARTGSRSGDGFRGHGQADVIIGDTGDLGRCHDNSRPSTPFERIMTPQSELVSS